MIPVAMWSFGHRVREVERSHDRVAFEETQALSVVWVFALVSFAAGFAAVRNVLVRGDLRASVIGLALLLWFGALALYTLVGSTFIVDRSLGKLIVQRRIALWSLQKTYRTETIDRLVVVETQKGSGLAVHFKSGKRKTLTTSLGENFIVVEAAALALNVYMHGRRQR
jgi:hypothetical protein